MRLGTAGMTVLTEGRQGLWAPFLLTDLCLTHLTSEQLRDEGAEAVWSAEHQFLELKQSPHVLMGWWDY